MGGMARRDTAKEEAFGGGVREVHNWRTATGSS